MKGSQNAWVEKLGEAIGGQVLQMVRRHLQEGKISCNIFCTRGGGLEKYPNGEHVTHEWARLVE